MDLTEEEKLLMTKICSECQSDEESENPNDKNCSTFIKHSVPWLKDEVMALKLKIDEFEESQREKSTLKYKRIIGAPTDRKPSSKVDKDLILVENVAE